MPDSNPIQAGSKSILGNMAGAMLLSPPVNPRPTDASFPAKSPTPPAAAPLRLPAMPGLGGKLDLYDTSEPAHLGELSPDRTGDTLASLALGDFSQGLASRETETEPLVDLPFLIPLGRVSSPKSPVPGAGMGSQSIPSLGPLSPLGLNPGSGLGRTLDTAG